MVNNNETPDYGVTQAMLDSVQYRHTIAAIRQKQLAEAQEVWPVHVNEALHLLAGKVEMLTARIAQLEAGRG